MASRILVDPVFLVIMVDADEGLSHCFCAISSFGVEARVGSTDLMLCEITGAGRGLLVCITIHC